MSSMWPSSGVGGAGPDSLGGCVRAAHARVHACEARCHPSDKRSPTRSDKSLAVGEYPETTFAEVRVKRDTARKIPHNGADPMAAQMRGPALPLGGSVRADLAPG